MHYGQKHVIIWALEHVHSEERPPLQVKWAVALFGQSRLQLTRGPVFHLGGLERDSQTGVNDSAGRAVPRGEGRSKCRMARNDLLKSHLARVVVETRRGSPSKCLVIHCAFRRK